MAEQGGGWYLTRRRQLECGEARILVALIYTGTQDSPVLGPLPRNLPPLTGKQTQHFSAPAPTWGPYHYIHKTQGGEEAADETNDEGAIGHEHHLCCGAHAHPSCECGILDVHLCRAGRAGRGSVLSPEHWCALPHWVRLTPNQGWLRVYLSESELGIAALPVLCKHTTCPAQQAWASSVSYVLLDMPVGPVSAPAGALYAHTMPVGLHVPSPSADAECQLAPGAVLLLAVGTGSFHLHRKPGDGCAGEETEVQAG